MSQLEEQILKQNILEEHRQVHELQVRIKELRADVERYVAINAQLLGDLEKAKNQLVKLREQKPALYMSFSDCGNFIRYWTRDTKNLEATMAVNDFEVLEFYARPVPAEPRKHHEFASVMLDAQPFITAETYGGRYIVAMRFERLGKMQDCHAALLALLKSAGENS